MAKSSFFNGTGVSSNYVSDLEGITEESKEYRDAAAVSASQVAATATQIVSNVNITDVNAADAQASAALAANSVSDAADSASQASASQTAAAVSAAAALVTEGQSSSHAQTAASSSTAAEASEVASAASAANSATSATQAETAKTVTEAAKDASLAALDSFDDRYLGAKSAAPTVDNDGDTLITGSLYFNSTTAIMYVYGLGGWQAAGSSVNGTSDRQVYTATAGQTVFAATYDAGYICVYLNGVRLAPSDFTATNGTSITLASGAAVNDILETVAYGTFALADHLTQTQSDARYVNLSGDTMTSDLGVDGNVRIGGSAISATITGLTQTNLVVGSATGGEIVAYRNDATLAEGDFVGAFLFGNDDNSATEDHFAGMWATAHGTGGSVDVKFAGQKGLYEAGTPQMILKSEGDLLIGTTSITNYNNNAGTTADDGFVYLAQGILSVSSNKTGTGFVQYLNRTGTDGGIIDFRKDGVSVGVVGTRSGSLGIGNGDVGLEFNASNNDIYPKNVTTNSLSDGNIDLGSSSYRFKDLYLSGGVFLGGTGSANKLSDYEEGGYAVGFGGLATNYSSTTAQGSYVKVGRLVTVRFSVIFTSVNIGSGDAKVNLPFTPEAGQSASGSIAKNVRGGGSNGAAYDQIGLRILGDDPYIYVVKRNNAGSTGTATRSDMFASGTGNRLEGSISYFTAS